jgi:aminoglycoside phosphotransferase
MWKLDISDCPFEETIDVKLETGRKRAARGEVDMDALSPENRDMGSPEEILRKLEETRPETEDLVFTHGDYCLPNIYIHNGRLTGLLDLGRAGIADRWQDLALCIWSIRYNMRHRDEAETEKMVRTLLDALDLEMNEEKYRYYNLLDELF